MAAQKQVALRMQPQVDPKFGAPLAGTIREDTRRRIAKHEVLTTNLVGGTLVEYEDGSEFRCEFSRATITKATIDERFFTIETDGDARLLFDTHTLKTENINVTQRDGVFYVKTFWGINYAIAPAGVEIPKNVTF